MAEKILPSIDCMRDLLELDPSRGVLVWKSRTPFMFRSGNTSQDAVCRNWNKRYSGKEAFTATNKQGYKVGAINDSLLRAHRVIWAIHYGAWPVFQIDHINGDRSDNRICNLREATSQQNRWNCKPNKSASSRYKGVCWDKSRGLWNAKISTNGKTINLGRFEREEDAARAYNTMHVELAGKFSRINT